MTEKRILKKLRQLRKDNRWSCQQIAERALGKKTANAYGFIEKGTQPLKVSDLEKLAKFYSVPLSYFFV